MIKRHTVLLTIVATAAIGTPAASASGPSTRLVGPSTTVKLDSWETKEQAATWEKAGGWQATQQYCDSLKGKFPPLVCGSSVTAKKALKTKHTYRFTVTGLIAVSSAAKACGKAETLPDGTSAGTDAQFEFADALDPATCYLTTGPVTWDAFRWSLDGGKTWAHPIADDNPAAPNAKHTYTFTARGKGKKPQLKWYDVATTDNKGSLTIVYREKAAANKKAKK